MALKFAIQTVFEITAVIAVIYGFIREDKLIAFEERIADKIKTALAGNSSDGRSKDLDNMIARKENKVK